MTTAQPHRRLRADLGLALRRDACLPLNFGYIGCADCARACPVGALRVRTGEIVVGEACVGCGRCAAACETGALRLDGCEMPEALNADKRVVRIECRKAPEDASGETLRVACLAGIPVSQWLALVHAAGERPIEVIDRGWCSQCCGDTGLQDSLSRARLLLESLGFAPGQLPRRREIPTLAGAMRREPREAGEPISRRGFFGRVARGATAAATTAASAIDQPSRSSSLRPGALATPERDRRLALASALAKRMGRTVPPDLFPAINAGHACRDDGVCSAVCPTGALRRYQDEAHAGLEFDSAACIDCGACVAACERTALVAGPRATVVHDGVRRLTRRQLHECADCGGPTTQADGLCHACRSRAELARDGVAELFREGHP